MIAPPDVVSDAVNKLEKNAEEPNQKTRWRKNIFLLFREIGILMLILLAAFAFTGLIFGIFCLFGELWGLVVLAFMFLAFVFTQLML